MVMSIDLPPNTIACSIMAAVKYEVPVNIVLAVAEKEAGKPGQWVKNTNGTYDIGLMQFNTDYLKDLKKYGIKPDDVAHDGCYSFDLAAWRLRGHIQNDKFDLWTRVSNYHSRTPKYNVIYRQDVIKKAKKWQVWLERRFITYPLAKPALAPLKTLPDATEYKIDSESPIQPKKSKKLQYNKEAARALALYYAPKTLPSLRGVS